MYEQKIPQRLDIQIADPMTRCMYALKAKELKRQYPRRFKTFLDFILLEGTISEQQTNSCKL
jgi:hypothetical protein